MKKYLLLILSILMSYTVCAQCLGEDCSIKGRNKAAKKKAIKLTGSKRAGSTYSSGMGYKSRKKRKGVAFDPFSGGKSSKKDAGGFDPFEAENNKKKHKGGGGYDPFASNSKKRKGSRGSAYDPFESDGGRKSSKGGGYDPFESGGKRKGIAKGGYDPFSNSGKRKFRNASSNYDGWDTGTSRRKGSKGQPNDSWANGKKHKKTSGGNDSWARSKKISSSSGGGIWAMGGNNKPSGGRRGGGGNDSWDQNYAGGTAPPVYQREDNTPKSWSDFESNSFSTDVVFDRPHYYKYSLIYGQILKQDKNVDKQLAGESLRPVLGAEFAIEYPTQGDKNWHHYFNMPTYGFALAYLNLGNDDKLGSAIAFYPYIDIPLIRSKAIDFNFTNGFGIGYVTKYDNSSASSPEVESYLIGSPINVFLKSGLSINYRPITNIRSDKDEMNSRYTISAGISMMHLSNGSFSSPNSGINMLAGSLSIKHTPMQVTQVLRQNPDEIPHYFTLDVMATGGVREMQRFDTEKYPVGNLNVTAYYQLLNIYRVGLGVDAFYDGAFMDSHNYTSISANDATTRYDGLYEEGKLENCIRGGLCLSNELVLGRTTAAVDGGYYLYDNIKAKDESMYFRFALKYRFTNHFFGALALKTHQLHAEFLSLGVGYSIPMY